MRVLNATDPSHLNGIKDLKQARVTNTNGFITVTAGRNDKIEVLQIGGHTANEGTLRILINGTEAVDINLHDAVSVTLVGGSGPQSVKIDPGVKFPVRTEPVPDSKLKADEALKRLGRAGRDVYLIHKLRADEALKRLNRGEGTICIPISQNAQIPPPAVAVAKEPCSPRAALSPEEIQRQWNQVIQQSNNHAVVSQSREGCRSGKREKLERLLLIALQSGHTELAILLMTGLESAEANEIAGGLMTRIRELQGQRQSLAQEMEKIGKDDPSKLTALNNQASNLGTEIQMIQIFLQEVMAEKHEAQQLASNFLKSQHDTAQSIIRNSG